MTATLQKIISTLLVSLMIALSAVFGTGRSASLTAVEKNVTEGLLSGALPLFSGSDIADGAALLSLTEADEDGNLRFVDVDYANQDRSSWKTARHLARTERLAVLFRHETDPQTKAVYKDAVLRLLDHWIEHDYTNPNWWHNKLSDPNILGEIGLMMKQELSAEQLRGLAVLVGRGCYSVDPTLRAYPGANTMDIAMSSIKYGLLTGYAPAVRTALNEVSGALKYSLSEGIKRDGTFFQHGTRLYMGGYGVGFIGSFLHIVRMVAGTEYMFTSDQLEPLSKFILTGMRTVSFGKTLDPTVMGRSVSRMNAQPLTGLSRTLTQLAELCDIPGKEEILAYAASIQNDEKQNYGLHYFENAKFLVIQNEDFYFSFRGGDNLLYYAEITNDENVLCYNSTFPGVTTIMHTGQEYVNISPLFDYAMVPGTTAVPETDEEICAHEDATYRSLPGVYGSSVANGAAAVFAKTKHEGIHMTVACFATDNAAILLGAGMEDDGGRQMVTTLDQSFFTGSFLQEGNTVIHNGIRYELLQGGALLAKSERRTGSWRRNNLTLADIPAEGDIFTVYTENTGSYAYTVMAENTDAHFEVIVNTPAVQAVKLPDGRLAAAFYTSGSFTYQGKTYIGVPGTARIFG
jgi:chondroitin AC lyase